MEFSLESLPDAEKYWEGGGSQNGGATRARGSFCWNALADRRLRFTQTAYADFRFENGIIIGEDTLPSPLGLLCALCQLRRINRGRFG